MGFDAIWISPVVENVGAGSYHGYWAKNLYEVNPQFGSKEDLKELVTKCHSRNIWVMVDVVPNHMGPDPNYSHFHPFNKPEYFHPDCTINMEDFYNN